jgi:four helix bundle protein
MKEIVPKLPIHEKFDLKDQLSRSCKAVPRLIAEGYAKKHQKSGFQKYLDDAMAESNETGVGLCQCKDIYEECVNKSTCESLIKDYDIISKQIFRLKEAWNKFKFKKPDSDKE